MTLHLEFDNIFSHFLIQKTPLAMNFYPQLRAFQIGIYFIHYSKKSNLSALFSHTGKPDFHHITLLFHLKISNILSLRFRCCFISLSPVAIPVGTILLSLHKWSWTHRRTRINIRYLKIQREI